MLNASFADWATDEQAIYNRLDLLGNTIKDLARLIDRHYETTRRMFADFMAETGGIALRGRLHSGRNCNVRIPRCTAIRFIRWHLAKAAYQDRKREAELDARHALDASGVRVKCPQKRTGRRRTAEKVRRLRKS